MVLKLQKPPHEQIEASPANDTGPAPQPKLVAEVFEAFSQWLPADLTQAQCDWSSGQLLTISEYVAAEAARDFIVGSPEPKVSAINSARKKFVSNWLEIIKDLNEDVLAVKGVKAIIATGVKASFDKVAHKALTGHDLPTGKDALAANALQKIRETTQHGDAALLLYRIRYWWPRAVLVVNGKKWIAKSHSDWAYELGMKERTFKTAYERLIALDLIESIIAKFNSAPTLHVRPTEKGRKLIGEDQD